MLSASLLALPTELRIEIYQYIFASQDTIHNPWLSLLLTNRTLHAEVSDILKDATLRVRIQPLIFHRPLAENLQLQKLSHDMDIDLDPFTRIAYFQTYCMRFGAVVFDITATQGPIVCLLQPSYERKGKELADALTAQLTATTSSSKKGPNVSIKWGSFSRNVYRGITTWDCCVLKGMGSIMALSLSRGTRLSEVLYCAIVLEERHRRGLLGPLPLIANVQPSTAGERQRGFGLGLAAKVKLAMHGRA